MADSKFIPENERFGRRAHEAAWERVYMPFLPDDVVVVDLSWTKRDAEQDEDREARVFLDGIDHPLDISIQERFRRIEYSDYREVTWTIYDHAHQQEGHLDDSEADFMVYGYYDDEEERLGETVVVNMSRLKYLLATGQVEYTTQYHRAQHNEFVAIPFDDLIEGGAVEEHYVPGD